jgi:hypothetical protein
LIRGFTTKYPLEKFITVEELDRICEKYDLIHAPIVNYVKDIPEKNLLEIKRCKPLSQDDSYKGTITIIHTDLEGRFALSLLGKNEFTLKEIQEIFKCWSAESSSFYPKSLTSADITWFEHGLKCKFNLSSYPNCYESKIVDKSGLFIAAPKSHFNLEGLTKATKYGFFTVTKQEVKDPVVFEFCNEEIVRIISKWGTDDDQSYLDPALLNENHN